MIRVTIWNEFIHEQDFPKIKEIYPEGIHQVLADVFKADEDFAVRTVTLQDPGQGLSDDILKNTDVLIYWAHCAHDEVTDENAQRIAEYVRRGMGFIPLHSAHFSKAIKLLLGTTMTLSWKEGDSERLFVTDPTHPIAAGLQSYFDIPEEELYGEFFDIPKPDDVIFTGWFKGGYVFRSGVTFTRGYGKIFYFQPGHEEYPVYYMPEIQQIIKNAARWAAPVGGQRPLFDNIALV